MKQEDKTELTKLKILTAAINEFGTKGYSGGSLNNICGRGIPKGLLYHNFKNKDAVYLACIDECFSRITKYLEEAQIGSDLHLYLEARLKFFQCYTEEAHIFFEALLEPPIHLQSEIAPLRRDFDLLNHRLYHQILASLSLRDGISEDDAMAYFTMMQNMFNGYFSSPAYRAISFQDKVKAHETNLKKLLDFMIYGIARGEK